MKYSLMNMHKAKQRRTEHNTINTTIGWHQQFAVCTINDFYDKLFDNIIHEWIMWIIYCVCLYKLELSWNKNFPNLNKIKYIPANDTIFTILKLTINTPASGQLQNGNTLLAAYSDVSPIIGGENFISDKILWTWWY